MKRVVSDFVTIERVDRMWETRTIKIIIIKISSQACSACAFLQFSRDPFFSFTNHFELFDSIAIDIGSLIERVLGIQMKFLNLFFHQSEIMNFHKGQSSWIVGGVGTTMENIPSGKAEFRGIQGWILFKDTEDMFLVILINFIHICLHVMDSFNERVEFSIQILKQT